MSKVQSTQEVVAERVVKAKALKAKGYTIKEICTEMSLPSGTIGYYLYGHNKPAKVKHAVTQRSRGVVSVLGATNNVQHPDWFVAGWVAAYATAKGLDAKGLIEDATRIIEGKEAQ